MFGVAGPPTPSLLPPRPPKRKWGGCSGNDSRTGHTGSARRKQTSTLPIVSKKVPHLRPAHSIQHSPHSAFPALRKLAPSRKPLSRGRFTPLSDEEKRAALDEATRDINAASSVGPQRSKLNTIHKFLHCFGLELLPPGGARRQC